MKYVFVYIHMNLNIQTFTYSVVTLVPAKRLEIPRFLYRDIIDRVLFYIKISVRPPNSPHKDFVSVRQLQNYLTFHLRSRVIDLEFNVLSNLCLLSFDHDSFRFGRFLTLINFQIIAFT